MRAAVPAILSAALLVAIGGDAEALRRPASRECGAEIGTAAARRLAQECREAGPARLSICRPETACDALRDAIAEACRLPGAETRPVCADTVEEDDDEDE